MLLMMSKFGNLLKRLLNAEGFSAKCFHSAQSFLDSVPTSQWGCVIMDVQMPDCNGFGLIDKMRNLHYDMPAIVITGYAQADARDIAMQKGAIGFLQKPFSAESLLELLEKSGTE
jgi:FixJ family two-component response regulator